MKSIFLDTNVIIDFLADRQPFAVSAAEIFNASLAGEVKIFISAVSYNNMYYILRRYLSHVETIKLLDEIADMTEPVDLTKAIIKKALKSDFKDFEDAIQYHCALSIKEIDFIVTRDSKDFKKSTLPVMNPKEALGIIRSKRN